MGNKPFAEILHSELFWFLGQSWRWEVSPEFGELVTINEPWGIRFAIITHVQTGSCEQGRLPLAYGKTHEELKQEQPHIFEFLQTTFRCVNSGFSQDTTLSYQPAPKPARIHAFIAPATQEQWQTFFNNPGYIRTLFSLANHISNLDELLLAICQHLQNRTLLSRSQLTAIANTLVDLFSEDYRRLRNFLARADQLVRCHAPDPLESSKTPTTL